MREIHRSHGEAVKTVITLGVEISCADEVHVVGIFKAESHQAIQSWLAEYVMDEVEGTFKTSFDVLEWIQSINGIGYIAHINTSKIFTDGKFLNNAYKKKLFGAEYLCAIGVNAKEQKEGIEAFVKKMTDRKLPFVIDNDSHSFDTLGKKVFWVKGVTVGYDMIVGAFRDFDIAIAYAPPKSPETYIRALYVDPGHHGFLSDKNGSSFETIFSESLNCLIGPRGSGKSTVLSILGFMMGQPVVSERDLEFICNHKRILVFFNHKGQDYYVSFMIPEFGYFNSVRNIFGDIEYRGYDGYIYDDFDNQKVAQNAMREHFQVWKLITNKKNIAYNRQLAQIAVKPSDNAKLLKRVFRATYSINDLVENAKGYQLGGTIQQLILGDALERFDIESIKRPHTVTEWIGFLRKIEESNQFNTDKTKEILRDFNSKYASLQTSHNTS